MSHRVMMLETNNKCIGLICMNVYYTMIYKLGQVFAHPITTAEELTERITGGDKQTPNYAYVRPNQATACYCD